METLTLRFWECEHDEDAEDYARAIQAAGGEVVATEIDYDHEECIITVRTADPRAFLERFRRTEAAMFTAIGYMDWE